MIERRHGEPEIAVRERSERRDEQPRGDVADRPADRAAIDVHAHPREMHAHVIESPIVVAAMQLAHQCIELGVLPGFREQPDARAIDDSHDASSRARGAISCMNPSTAASS